MKGKALLRLNEMKILLVYSCVMLILCCIAPVSAEYCHKKCQLLSIAEHPIWLDPGIGTKSGRPYATIKNGAGNMSKRDSVHVKNRSTLDPDTYDCLRTCKRANCKQQTSGDFYSFEHADALYPLKTLDHYMKRNKDRGYGFGFSNVTSDSDNECCCKKWACGSDDNCTKGERMHAKEPLDKLLPSLQLSLMISVIATTTSFCSMVFMFIMWNCSHLRRGLQSQEYECSTQRSRRQRRRQRQRKKSKMASKQTDNDAVEQNVNVSFNLSNNKESRLNDNEALKPDVDRISEQRDGFKVLSSTRGDVRSASNGVIYISQSQQTEHPAEEPENELCTSATQVKQYKFSKEAKCSSKKEIITENNNKSIENERTCTQSVPLLKDLFEHDDLILDSNSNDKTFAADVLPLNPIPDLDQESLLVLKLPHPSIHDTEETVPKGSQNIQDEITSFHRTHFTYSTGYPFSTDSTESLKQYCPTPNTSVEDTGLLDYEVRVKAKKNHSSYFENENEENVREINEYSERRFSEKDEFEYDCSINKKLRNQTSDQKGLFSDELVDNDDHEVCQENVQSFPTDMEVSSNLAVHQGSINASHFLPKETEALEEIADSVEPLRLDSTNEDDKRLGDITSNDFKKIEEKEEMDNQSTLRNKRKRGKSMSENRLIECQRVSSNCSEEKYKCTYQVNETVPFTSIDSCSYLQLTLFANNTVKVNSCSEGCNHLDKSGSDIKSSSINIDAIHCSQICERKNRYKVDLKVKNRKRNFRGLAKRGNTSSNESSLNLPLIKNDRKANDKKKFCEVCHKLNNLCKGHHRYPEYRYTRLCSTRFGSTNFSKDHTKKDEYKLRNMEEVVSLVCQDSGFISEKSTERSDSWQEKNNPIFCEKRPVELFHECLLKEIKLEKLSTDFFQQLKVLKNGIEDVERRLVAKEISKELHIEYRNFTIFGLDSYFDRFNTGPPPTTHERMQYEWIRLASFSNYTGNGNALALARNGFYHDHNEGPMSTRCYLCEARHSQWEMFDNISAEHRRQSPNCPFHDNREEETLNISITHGESSETPGRSSLRSAGRSVTSSSSTSTVAAAVRDVSNSFQGINISQAHIGNSGGESISHQPTEDAESGARSLLALSQPRTQQVLGRTGHAYSTIIAPRRNNVATGARSNVGFGPLNGSSSSSGTGSQLPSSRPSSILGGPVGAGAFSGLRTADQTTGAPTSVSRATEGLQQNNAPSPSAEAAGTQQTKPASGSGGRTDPTITVLVDNPKHPEYVNIDSRVGSYQGWPDYLDQTPRQMSEAGFFFVGVADFTRCFCCGGGLRNWEPGDDPMLEHTRWFSRCEYVNKLKGERYVAAVQRRHQEHMAEQQRQQIELSQIRDENRNPPDPMTTEAAAVMQEMGYSADRTREAILAVRRQTGSSVVNTHQVLTWLLDDEERRLTGNSSNSELGIRPPPMSTSNVSPGTSTPSSIVYTGASISSSIVYTGTSIGTSIMNTTSSISTATSVVSAGTTTSSVSSTSTSVAAEVQQTSTATSANTGRSSSATGNQQTGSGNSSNSPSGSGVEKSGASGGDSDESKPTAKEDTGSHEPTAIITKKKKAKKKAKNKARAKSSETSDAKSLKAENEKLKEMQTCKICMERAVNTTILPCGHLVCCDICAARLHRCPICRKRIKGTVKTFMS